MNSDISPLVTHMSYCVTKTQEQTVSIVPVLQRRSLELREGQSLVLGSLQTLNSPGV